MPTLTIYTVSADISLLNAILNGVAMICQQNALIWGFALLAAFWRLAATTTKATIETSKGGAGGGALAHGSISAVMPFIFAMLLTNPVLQSRVQVESTVNGTVTVVDNVPFVIAVIPAAASLMSQEVGAVVETAYQGTGTDYAAISASGNGFINPLKVLLTSRTAVLRLGSIDSQVKSVLMACLASDSGADFGAIHEKVLNAGNSGATSAESVEVSDLSGTKPTAIGALLFQAKQNTSSFVPDINVNGSSFLSCSDAVDQVSANINDALNSNEFKRVAQGAVNAMDQPIPAADFSITQLGRQYAALRTANTVTNTLAGGTAQANAEIINLLFSELVNNSLDCLKADSTNKVACQAAVMQANEMERNNIQAAAGQVPMLKYAGNFANFMLALVIGLGPVILMFMMFAGVDAGKNIKTAVHIMVWPLLVMNVGAELVNGMIYITTANFLTSITQGGYLSQAVAIEAYKQFSLQIGTASHIMASLPILMSMIFVLGESSALTHVANSLNPKSKEAADLAAPTATNAVPIMQQRSMATADQGVGFSNVKQTGAIDAVATSATHGNLAKEASATNTAARTQQRNITEGEQNVADWKEAFSKGDYSKFGIDKRTGESIRNSYEKNQSEAERQSTARDVTSGKTNANATKLAAHTSAGVSGSVGLTGVSASATAAAGVSAETSTTGSDTMGATTKTAKERSVNESQSLSKAISAEVGKTTTTSTGNDKTHQLQKSVDTQKTYQKSLSDSASNTDATSIANKENSNFVQSSAKIGNTEIAHQRASNGDFAMQQILSGPQFDALPAAQKHRAVAQKDMDNGATDQMVGNKEGRESAIRHRSAVMLAQDQAASPEDRFKAVEYLTQSAAAMQHMNFQAGDTSMRENKIEAPKDRTGVDSVDLTKRANPPAPPVKATVTRASKAKRPVHPKAGAQPVETVPQAIPESIESSVKAEVATAQKIANQADLGPHGSGTAKRAASNVVDNVKSLARPAGAPSKTSVGDLGAEAQKQKGGRPEDQIPR